MITTGYIVIQFFSLNRYLMTHHKFVKNQHCHGVWTHTHLMHASAEWYMGGACSNTPLDIVVRKRWFNQQGNLLKQVDTGCHIYQSQWQWHHGVLCHSQHCQYVKSTKAIPLKLRPAYLKIALRSLLSGSECSKAWLVLTSRPCALHAAGWS